MVLQDLVNDILRKIGRNIMLFQELEHLLKAVIAGGNISGYVSEIKDIKTKQEEAVKKQTMGQLVGLFIENNVPDYEANFEEPEELKEAHISINFRIDSSPERYAAKKESLAKLVNERNELVHHLLPRFDTKSKTSCDELSKQLDSQSEIIRNEIKELREVIASRTKSIKALASYHSSAEGREQLERDYLRQSKLASMLFDIADQLGNEDGWISMSQAAHIVRQHAPEELDKLRDIYGCKTLKSFMLATDQFEFNEVKTNKGGVRVVYKLKPNVNEQPKDQLAT